MSDKDFSPEYMYVEDKKELEKMLAKVIIPEDARGKILGETLSQFQKDLDTLKEILTQPVRDSRCPDDANLKTVMMPQERYDRLKVILPRLCEVFAQSFVWNTKILDNAFHVINATTQQAAVVNRINEVIGLSVEHAGLVSQKIDESVDAIENRSVELEGKMAASEIERKKKLCENQDKVTAEVERLDAAKQTKLTEMQDELDTLKLHVKPSFKAKLQSEKDDAAPYRKPYEYGKRD